MRISKLALLNSKKKYKIWQKMTTVLFSRHIRPPGQGWASLQLNLHRVDPSQRPIPRGRWWKATKTSLFSIVSCKSKWISSKLPWKFIRERSRILERKMESLSLSIKSWSMRIETFKKFSKNSQRSSAPSKIDKGCLGCGYWETQ